MIVNIRSGIVLAHLSGSVYIPFVPFSFSYLRTKNEKRIPFSFFVFISEVRTTKNESGKSW